MPSINPHHKTIMNKLPDELLIVVFKSLVCSYPWRHPAVHRTLSTIVAVSALWRSVVLSACELWRFIDWATSDEDCEPLSERLVQQRAIAYLERSRSTSIDVRFHHRAEGGNDNGQFTQWKLFSSIVLLHRERIRTLDVQFYFNRAPSVSAIFPIVGLFPSVESLLVSVRALASVRSAFQGRGGLLVFQEPNALRPHSFFLHTPIYMLLTNITPSRLRVFHAQFQVIGAVDEDTWRFVYASPQLQRMMLHVRGPRVHITGSQPAPHHAQPGHELGCLQSMSFLGNYPARAISAPNLRSLRISITSEPLPDIYECIKGLSALKFLSILCETWSRRHEACMKSILHNAKSIVELSLPQWSWMDLSESLTLLLPESVNVADLGPESSTTSALTPTTMQSPAQSSFLPRLCLITISFSEQTEWNGLTYEAIYMTFGPITKARPNMAISFDDYWINPPPTPAGRKEIVAISAERRELVG
ncbi:hypothetical protein DL93DRAFT_2102225 [Clavulina sp. PMI_390]|nr:hypothetical protein DL93DRAFT_2102225 [Clavulina sp. PMI_390]